MCSFYSASWTEVCLFLSWLSKLIWSDLWKLFWDVSVLDFLEGELKDVSGLWQWACLKSNIWAMIKDTRSSQLTSFYGSSCVDIKIINSLLPPAAQSTRLEAWGLRQCWWAEVKQMVRCSLVSRARLRGVYSLLCPSRCLHILKVGMIIKMYIKLSTSGAFSCHQYLLSKHAYSPESITNSGAPDSHLYLPGSKRHPLGSHTYLNSPYPGYPFW